MNLSVVIPYFRKLEELMTVFPMNKPYLLGAEIVLCLDEASSSEQVFSFAKQHPDIEWKILVNRNEHPWRAPTKAVNVGIRCSSRDYVLVVSPESKFVGNLPEIMLNKVRPDLAVVGQLSDCPYSRFLEIGDAAVGEYEAKRGIHYYGSICFHKTAAFHIGGYDECMSKWGGDDDNFRARLRLSGVKVVPDSTVNIVHLTFANNPKEGCQMNDLPKEYIHHPPTITCPVCFPNWGRDFEEVLYQR